MNDNKHVITDIIGVYALKFVLVKIVCMRNGPRSVYWMWAWISNFINLWGLKFSHKSGIDINIERPMWFIRVIITGFTSLGKHISNITWTYTYIELVEINVTIHTETWEKLYLWCNTYYFQSSWYGYKVSKLILWYWVWNFWLDIEKFLDIKQLIMNCHDNAIKKCGTLCIIMQHCKQKLQNQICCVLINTPLIVEFWEATLNANLGLTTKWMLSVTWGLPQHPKECKGCKKYEHRKCPLSNESKQIFQVSSYCEICNVRLKCKKEQIGIRE